MRRLILVVVLLLAFPLQAALTKSDLQAWLEEAIEAAKEVPAEDRRSLAYSIEYSGRSPDMVKAALLKIALRPSGNGWWDLTWVVQPGDKELALEFLEAAYRGRAGLESAEARQWQQGLAEILFCTGRFDEALRLQRQVVGSGDPSAYAVILLAMMERVAGNGEPYARLAADPPVSEFAGELSPARYMQSVVISVGKRLMQMLPASKVPPQIPLMMTGSPDWDDRMAGVIRVAESNVPTGMQELRKILTDPSAPEWAVNDAWFAIAQLPKFSLTQPADVVRALECWLSRRRIAIPPATPDTWEQLRSLEATREQEEWVDPRTRQCFHIHDGEPSAECLLSAAALYMMAATNARNYEASRRSIEWAAALSIEHGRGLNNIGLYLAIAAEFAPTPESGAQTLRYAATLPAQKFLHTGMGEEVSEAVRKQTERSVEVPWSGPLAPPARCP